MSEDPRMPLVLEVFEIAHDNHPESHPAIARDLPAALTRARGKVPYSPSGTLPGEYWRGYTAAIDEVRALLGADRG